MNPFEQTVVMFGFVVLRLMVPLAVTVLVVWWLRRLDTRWETEGRAQDMAAQVRSRGRTALREPDRPCWEIHGCSAEERSHCDACRNSSLPCWLVRMQLTGKLGGKCVGCGVLAGTQMAPAMGDD